MVTNTLKQNHYEVWNYQKVPGIIYVTLVHTLHVLVTKLVLNLKRTRSTNFADGLVLHSIVSPIQDKTKQIHLPSEFLVCQFEVLDEKYWQFQLNEVKIGQI